MYTLEESHFVAQNGANVPLGFGVLGKPNGLGGPVLKNESPPETSTQKRIPPGPFGQTST